MKLKALIISFLVLSMLGEGQALAVSWKHGVDGLVIRCFSVDRIKVHCEDFSDGTDPKIKVEELHIEAVNLGGRKFSYTYEHGIEGNLCQNHLIKIRRLLKNEKEACITGFEWIFPPEDETNAKWRALETSKGRVEW